MTLMSLMTKNTRMQNKTRFNSRRLRQPLPIFIHNTSFHFRGGHPYLWKDLPTAKSTSNEYEYFLVLILKLVIKDKKPDLTTDRQAAESAPCTVNIKTRLNNTK